MFLYLGSIGWFPKRVLASTLNIATNYVSLENSILRSSLFFRENFVTKELEVYRLSIGPSFGDIDFIKIMNSFMWSPNFIYIILL